MADQARLANIYFHLQTLGASSCAALLAGGAHPRAEGFALRGVNEWEHRRVGALPSPALGNMQANLL